MMRPKLNHSMLLTFALLLILLFSLPSIAQDIYELRLDSGLNNTDAYSYILIKKARTDPAQAKKMLTDAIKYSPSLPAAYFELAKISFSASPDRIFESLDYAMQGIKAYRGNFWWLMSISGLLLASLMLSLIVVLAIIICIRFFIESPLITHDIIEDKKKIMIILPLIPLSFLGPLFFIAGALFILGLYFRNVDKAVAYAAILLLLSSPFICHIANIFLSSHSPEMRAIVAVNENRDNKYAFSSLKGKNDFISLFSYGLALKREGHYNEAIAVYKNLLSSYQDPRIYINLGNCYVSINDMAAAKDAYKRALELRPLVSAHYNMSQVSRETLDFTAGEEHFREATKLDRESVSRFTSIASRNPNRFVIDETLPMSALWEHARTRSQEIVKPSGVLTTTTTVIVSIILLVLFYIIDTRIKKAYRCKRCRVILCDKCEKGLLWGQMCSKCYKSLVKLDELDPKERVAKLLEIQELQAKRRNIVRVLSFAPPGIAHIYSGRILAGSLYLWLFSFMAGLILLNPFLSTGLSSFSHSWLTIPAVSLMLLSYIISNISIRRKLSRGWL